MSEHKKTFSERKDEWNQAFEKFKKGFKCKCGNHDWEFFNGKTEQILFYKRRCRVCKKKDRLDASGKWVLESKSSV